MTFTEFLDWIVSSRGNLVKAVIALVMIIIIGAYLMTIPWHIRERSISNLSDEITETHERIIDVSGEWDEVDQWYDESYDDQINSQITQALEKINSAQQYRNSAMEIESPDPAVKTAQAGMSELESANELLESAEVYITNANQSRETAINSFEAAHKRLSELSKDDDAILRGFNKEADYYPQKRIVDYRVNIASSLRGLNEVYGLLLNAQWALPPESDESNKGNPSRATSFVTKAEQGLDAYQKMLDQISAWTTTLQNARLNAEPTLKASRDTYATSETTISTASQNRGYRYDGALKEAVALLQQAKAHIDFAQNELSQQPADYITALKAAQDAALAAEASGNEVASQIELDNTSAKLINELQTNIKRVTVLSSATSVSLQVLANHHGQATWNHVANNATGIKNALAQAQNDLVKLETARANQQFKLAVEEGSAGLDMLKQARTLIADVDTVRNTLENARSSWPAVEADAQSAIAESRGEVNKYSGYSSRSVSQLAHAESLFNEAQNLVARKNYQPAVENAQLAAVEAREAQRVAYADYQDEQDRIRRAREAEERREAAEAAAEAARQQQLLDNSSSYNYGSSSGSSYDYGSSSGSSYSGGSDYGSFSGSSGSDYGSFSGSSGSDYGSFPY